MDTKPPVGRVKATEDGLYRPIKSDRVRLWALISRDFRMVLIAAALSPALERVQTDVGRLWSLVAPHFL